MKTIPWWYASGLGRCVGKLRANENKFQNAGLDWRGKGPMIMGHFYDSSLNECSGHRGWVILHGSLCGSLFVNMPWVALGIWNAWLTFQKKSRKAFSSACVARFRFCVGWFALSALPRASSENHCTMKSQGKRIFELAFDGLTRRIRLCLRSIVLKDFQERSGPKRLGRLRQLALWRWVRCARNALFSCAQLAGMLNNMRWYLITGQGGHWYDRAVTYRAVTYIMGRSLTWRRFLRCSELAFIFCYLSENLGFLVSPVLEVFLSAVLSVFGFPLAARNDALLSGCSWCECLSRVRLAF